jgi:hypothetical protein
MRLVIALTVLWVVALGAHAQEARRDAPRRERAPLASPEDLEPAVNTSEPRVAVIDHEEAAAAAAAQPADPPRAATREPASPTPSTPSAAPAAGATPSASEQSIAATSVAPAPAPPASTAPQTGTPRVVDTLDLGTTSITGNQELPKVLYIVPWKKSDLGDLVGRPVNTLLDEVLTPVDPEVFERHLDYYETLHGKGLEE